MRYLYLLRMSKIKTEKFKWSKEYTAEVEYSFIINSNVK